MTISLKRQKQKLTELQFRGSVITISIAFEGTIMAIVYASNADQYKAPLHKRLKYKVYTFNKRIEILEEVLALHHPDLLSKYEQLFSDLKEFKEFRNVMAHCVLDWPTEGIDEFDVWDYVQDENGFSHPQAFRYKLNEAKQFAVNSSNKILRPLALLRDEIEQRLRVTHPHVYEILQKDGKRPEPKKFHD
jgi:hypothetical protein